MAMTQGAALSLHRDAAGEDEEWDEGEEVDPGLVDYLEAQEAEFEVVRSMREGSQVRRSC